MKNELFGIWKDDEKRNKLTPEEELEQLKQAVREYLERPSCDGRPDSGEMRRKLALLVK